MIEKLTEDERSWLAAPGPQTWPNITAEALRIIDALTAALAQAVERSDEDVKCLLEARVAIAQRDAALARAEAAERLHEQALNERDTAHEALETERKAKVEWERLRKQAYSLYRAEGDKRDRAESEAAALRERCRLLEVNRDSLLERNGRLVDETHRVLAEAAALRERVSVEERARSQSETLLQQVGARLDAVQQEAHAACLLWESHGNHSLREIRLGMRTLRDVLNKPALKTEAAALRAEVERLRGHATAECALRVEAVDTRLAAVEALLRRDGLLAKDPHGPWGETRTQREYREALSTATTRPPASTSAHAMAGTELNQYDDPPPRSVHVVHPAQAVERSDEDVKCDEALRGLFDAMADMTEEPRGFHVAHPAQQTAIDAFRREPAVTNGQPPEAVTPEERQETLHALGFETPSVDIYTAGDGVGLARRAAKEAPCTAEERAVLDACADAHLHDVVRGLFVYECEADAIARAELARRAAKETK